jgi:hypothetical protein
MHYYQLVNKEAHHVWVMTLSHPVMYIVLNIHIHVRIIIIHFYSNSYSKKKNKNDTVFHTLSEVKGTDTLSQEKKRVFTPFPD